MTFTAYGYVKELTVTVNGRKVVESYERRFGIGTNGMRVALVGCCAQKALVGCAARDLYRSPLFRASRAYAEATCQQWFILSAQYGLVDPLTIIDPYDRRLTTAAERKKWGELVGRRLEDVMPFPAFANAELVVLAGQEYADAISPADGREFFWEEPLRGKSIGERLRWLLANTPRKATR